MRPSTAAVVKNIRATLLRLQQQSAALDAAVHVAKCELAKSHLLLNRWKDGAGSQADAVVRPID